MADNHKPVSVPSDDSMLAHLGRTLDAVGDMIVRVRSDQWSAPTPCTDWDVRRLVEHLIGMNRVFTALLSGAPMPSRPGEGHFEPDSVSAYRESASALLRAFSEPGSLDREYVGPLGPATGADRLQIRLYDLLAHGWDLAHAINQPFDPPDRLAEQSLAFARAQLPDQARTGRFAPATDARPDAPALERLVAFLGRRTATP